MSKRITFFLLAIIFALYCVSGTLSLCECGRVYDGSEAKVDIKEQSSTTSLSGNWEGFGTIVEVAIVNEAGATERLKQSGWNASEAFRCRSLSEITGVPFIDFVNVTVGQENYTFEKLDLTKGATYYFVVRYTDHGEKHYSNSDGVLIKEESKDSKSSPPPHHHPSGSGGSSSSSGDDDDDDLEDWEIGLIAMGCALCCLLLLLLILLLVLAKGKGDDKYTTTVHRNDNVDKL